MKLQVKTLIVSLILLFTSFALQESLANDFVRPNSSGDPVIIDISNLNVTGGVDVSFGEFTGQPRPYRDTGTSSLVLFPPPIPDSEQTLTVRIGDTSVSKTISFRPSPNGTLKNSLLPSLQKSRGGSTVTKISDGRLVLIGGSSEISDRPISTIEIFDLETGGGDYLRGSDGIKKAKLNTARGQHTATYLGISNSPIGNISAPVEQILVVGGFSKEGVLQKTIEIVEIKVGANLGVSTQLTTKKGKLQTARSFHTASLLPDGRVLIIGGQGSLTKSRLGALNSIEIFDPVTKTVQPSTLSLNTPRLLHSATTLQNGNILIVGGFTNEAARRFGFGPGTNVAELIDTGTFTIRKVGNLSQAVGGHAASLLTNGNVVITGGNLDFFSGKDENILRGLTVGSVQFYDDATESFGFIVNKLTGGNLELQRSRFLHTSVLLPNGNLAVIGGLNIKPGTDLASFVNTPVAKIEVLSIDLLSSGTLSAIPKSDLESSVGRILPNAILVTPKNRTEGFLTATDTNKFVNSAIFLAGGFTNGRGRLPTNVNELLTIESNIGAEGRQIKLTPEAAIKGSSIDSFLIKLDNFDEVPAIKIQPQTVNLSSSNNFTSTAQVISTDDQLVLLKAEVNDPSNSVIVSPTLFQTGETLTVTRKDESILGEFDVTISPVEEIGDFIPATLKVNVSSSSKPFLATVPASGVSLSNNETENTKSIQVKVFSQDGMTEFTAIPANTEVTATVGDSEIANLGGTGISSVTGNLQTQFTVVGVKPGKTSLNFSINFPDILSVSVPVEVSGTPTFSSVPIDTSVLTSLASIGFEIASTTVENSLTVSLDDFRVVPNSSLFPVYIPVNLLSSVDGSSLIGQITIRPIFGVDLSTAIPRTLVNKLKTAFRKPFAGTVTAIGGIANSEVLEEPIAAIGLNNGIRTVEYDEEITEQISVSPSMLSNISSVDDIGFFEFGTNTNSIKVAALKDSMIFVINSADGNIETSASLSGKGQEMRLTEINGQTAAVVGVGSNGIDLVFPLTDAEPRVENSQVSSNVKSITLVKQLGSKAGPYVVSYDNSKTILIRNLTDLNEVIQDIDAEEDGNIQKIDYAGKYTVNGVVTDVLLAYAGRNILLYDLNNHKRIPVQNKLKIKSKIYDVLVIDGIAYLALGSKGILAFSVGALIDNNANNVEIARFTKNILPVIKQNGIGVIKRKRLNAKKLANSKPFLLSSGTNNDITIIRISP